MLIDLNFRIKNLDGEEISLDEKNDTIAKILANFLVIKSKHLTSLKAYDFAVKLHASGKLEIDREDAEALMKEIQDSDFTNLVKAQLLIYLKDELIKQAQ